jgi:DNA-binding LytR/AlgR family response regulator
MNDSTSILIVEDDMVIAANISLQLTKLGYSVTGIESRGEDAVHHAKENLPDIILMDINLKGQLDGIETAKLIQKFSDIPLIYLTGNSDEVSFQKAKETHPFAFISKPFNKLNLERTVALVVEKVTEENNKQRKEIAIVATLEDRIFIRSQKKLIKVMLDEILYIEAERNYCNIITVDQNFTITSPLNVFCEKIVNKDFLRVHRSYVVNIKKLDAVADAHLEINKKIIPISKMYKEDLMKSIKKV